MSISQRHLTINRSALYHILIKRGINGKLLEITYRVYNQATCQVTWKGSVGEKMHSNYGVLQRGMASPFLFSDFVYFIYLKDFSI